MLKKAGTPVIGEGLFFYFVYLFIYRVFANSCIDSFQDTANVYVTVTVLITERGVVFFELWFNPYLANVDNMASSYQC